MKAHARRQQVAYGVKRGLSQRRACTLFSVARSGLTYRSRMDTKDLPVIEAMRRLSSRYPRFGYRRMQVMLGREGHLMSADRVYRLWCKAALQVPKKRQAGRCITTQATTRIGSEPGVGL